MSRALPEYTALLDQDSNPSVRLKWKASRYRKNPGDPIPDSYSRSNLSENLPEVDATSEKSKIVSARNMQKYWTNTLAHIDGVMCMDPLIDGYGSLCVYDGKTRLSVEDIQALVDIAVKHQLFSSVTLRSRPDYTDVIRDIATCIRDVPLRYVRGDPSQLKEFFSVPRSQKIDKIYFRSPTIAGLEDVLAFKDAAAVEDFEVDIEIGTYDTPRKVDIIGRYMRSIIKMIHHCAKVRYRIYIAPHMPTAPCIRALAKSLEGNIFHITNVSIDFHTLNDCGIPNERVVVRDEADARKALIATYSGRDWSTRYPCELYKCFPQETKHAVEAVELATRATSNRLPPELMSLVIGALMMAC
jgi:hypothetical protein